MQQAVRVLVDEPAIDREFTYLLPPEIASGRVQVQVGTIVRVMLNRRRLRGWITQTGAPVPEGRKLVAISSVAGVGPPPHVLDLAAWAAWRWAGTRVHFLRIASADRAVAGLPPPTRLRVPAAAEAPDWVSRALERASARPARLCVTRLGPCADGWPVVAAALRLGRVLVLAPTSSAAARLAGLARQAGVSVASTPREWAGAAVAQAVVGARACAWAPCGRLDAAVVLDEHDEAYQSEAAPTWNARDVVIERARRDGAACLLVGPMPSPDALRLVASAPVLPQHSTRQQHTSPDAPKLAAGTPVLPQHSTQQQHTSPDALRLAASTPAPTPSPADDLASLVVAPRPVERESWPRVDTADRRRDDPAMGQWCGEALTELLCSGRSVVCVLNRKGRARLAYCASCGTLAVSARTGRALRLEQQQFVDDASGEVRPAVCEGCGATRFRRARVGVKGVAEEMERLARRPVIQVAAGQAGGAMAAGQAGGAMAAGQAGGVMAAGQARLASGAAGHSAAADAGALYIGTEAVLHRVTSADAVAFVDFDQELTAPRYRAGEEAFALLVRAARVVGPRSGGGRILVQTRMPGHRVLQAATEADPGEWVRAEAVRRSLMCQPPAWSWAIVSGASAADYADRLIAGDRAGALDISQSAAGAWRVRCEDRTTLLDALALTPRPPGRLRVAVDPLRA